MLMHIGSMTSYRTNISSHLIGEQTLIHMKRGMTVAVTLLELRMHSSVNKRGTNDTVFFQIRVSI